MTARTRARPKAGPGCSTFVISGRSPLIATTNPFRWAGPGWSRHSPCCSSGGPGRELRRPRRGHVGARTGPRSSSTLDSHVWRLRNVLEPGRARGEPATVLLREPGGYRLVAAPEQVDSLRFAVLADDTLRLLSDGQAARALRRCEEALQLWRGRPFGAVADEPWARPAVARLEELRAQVRERHIAAMLAIGDPERALVELTSAIADDPLRERLWVQRMLAYHRTGRTDRALATYQEARSLFRAELGIEPGGELRALQAQILAGDAAPPVPAPRGRARRPRSTCPAGAADRA